MSTFFLCWNKTSAILWLSDIGEKPLELKKRLVFAVTLSVMTCSLNFFDFSESKISLTPEQKENLGCFIEAQETLGRKCSLLDLDRKSAFLSSVNGYGSRIVYDFDYPRNL